MIRYSAEDLLRVSIAWVRVIGFDYIPRCSCLYCTVHDLVWSRKVVRGRRLGCAVYQKLHCRNLQKGSISQQIGAEKSF